MKYTFNPITVVKIHSSYVDEDILERLDGCEAYEDEFGNRIYNVAEIEYMLNDPEDDTNEDTAYRLSRFLEEAKTHNAEKVLIIP